MPKRTFLSRQFLGRGGSKIAAHSAHISHDVLFFVSRMSQRCLCLLSRQYQSASLPTLQNLALMLTPAFAQKKAWPAGIVLSRNNQNQQNLFKFGFLSPVWALSALLRCWDVRRCNRPVWALPTLLLVLGCTAVQSACVGASYPAAGVGMYGDAIGPCGRFLPCYGCWHVREV